MEEAFRAAGFRKQAELARRLKASPSQVSRWYRGQTPHEEFWQPRILRELRRAGVERTAEELWPPKNGDEA